MIFTTTVNVIFLIRVYALYHRNSKGRFPGAQLSTNAHE